MLNLVFATVVISALNRKFIHACQICRAVLVRSNESNNLSSLTSLEVYRVSFVSPNAFHVTPLHVVYISKFSTSN
jgi:hypothetical protein